nr:alanyl-tRNA editing protein [Palleronia pontilimi]
MYLDDPYLRTAPGDVIAAGDGWVRVDPCLFYPTGGGQPGDSGTLLWDGGSAGVRVCEHGDGGVVLRLSDGARPSVGQRITQAIDWDRRWGHMRIHTALHLLSVVIPLPVTGGSISAAKGRLDFDMPTPPEDKQALSDALADLVARDLPVTTDWITDAELDANPGLVKTLRVQPPRGSGRVRLVRIGQGDAQVDLQPCGGTHVARTGEIGAVRLGKIEKKGGQNRRVYLHLDP